MAYQTIYANKKLSAGFTLIEALVVMGILAILLSASFSAFTYFVAPQNLASSKTGVVEAIHLARVRSQSGSADASWGVKITATDVVIFKGTSYATRDVDYDQSLDLSNVTPSGLDEIIFDKITGSASPAGTITLTNDFGSHNININEKGTLTY